jgi:hypothetical protein
MMEKESPGGLILRLMKSVCIGFVKLVAVLLAWLCKIIGCALLKISELTFKLVEK